MLLEVIKKTSPHYLSAGFTLIELIMVIIILGILSSFALPKFADINNDAARSVIDGAVSNVKSAGGISHVKWLASNQTTPIDLEGKFIDIVNGYPTANIAATNGHIAQAAGLDGSDWVLANPASDKMSITFKEYCFTYTEAANTSSAPIISAVQAAPCS